MHAHAGGNTVAGNLDTVPLPVSRCGQLRHPERMSLLDGKRLQSAPTEVRMRPHRVELPSTLAHLPFLGAERFGERPAQRFKRDGVWRDLTYAEQRDIAREVALGLVALGIRPGDRVCVLSETRPEWVQAEFGIAAAGAVVVPIYPSSSPEFPISHSHSSGELDG